jgi:hypothetical protein
VSRGWEGVLDALEAEVEATARPAESTGENPAFVPPAGLGPVPPALVERVVTLLGRMTEREQDLEQRRAEVGRELAALSAAHAGGTAARPVPRFFDASA